ncbi:receptor-like protein Cf-9 homolog [Cannabis sativa]|uniref:receptor-like protein Cf-9 homolog n=1 Tax=Cannabis sativa TaxID=3483 RepID=UPI0029C9E630|nr:receptor-like protein Cf-9 homolog [Cannabis sativa]
MPLLSNLHSLLSYFFFFFFSIVPSHESSALLHFKNSFSNINGTTYCYDYYHLEIVNPNSAISWDIKSKDCCRWSGVTCDDVTGHVIRLDLKCSELQGILHSNNTLFSLSHLQSLILSYNNFSQSKISSEFVAKSRSNCLTCLTCLHLSGNNHLKLETSSWKRTVANLTNLRELFLSEVNMSSTSPDSFMNLSTFLTSLDLSYSELQGKLPENVLSEIPEICSNSTKNPFSCISSKHHLVGSPPLHLAFLYLSRNELNGTIPSWIYSLPSLQDLDLSSNKFSGSIQEFQHNSLLSVLLHNNNLQGFFPTSIFQQVNLSNLELFSNNMSGVMQLDQFSKLKKLEYLSLSNNNFSCVSNNYNNDTFPNTLIGLYLSSCGISEFPYFLRSLQNLLLLDLSNNQIEGSVPQWLWNVGKDSLIFLDISHNSLTQIDQIPWKTLQLINLAFNRLQGHLPILPPYTQFISISNNSFVGEISPSICNLSELQVVDLSNNKLSGNIPPCLGNSSSYLEVLDLRKNKFHGIVPLAFAKGNSLRVLNVNENHLEGSLPNHWSTIKSWNF